MASDRLSFEGRVAVVTGAGRGLGRAYALLLASRGAKVLVNDLGTDLEGRGADPAPAEAVVAEIEAAGGEAAANSASVATRAGAHAIVAAAHERWGRVDIVVNNAGGDAGAHTIDELPEEELRLAVDCHLLGPFFVIGAAWQHMVEQRYGRIVNTSSGAAFGQPGRYPYSAAKAGVIALTRALAYDGEEHGIKANAVLPVAGTRRIDKIPHADMRAWINENLRADQVAAVVAAMAHEAVPFTGEAISAHGGHAARVFYGISPGYVDPDLTPEAVLEHVDQVLDTADFSVPGLGQTTLRDAKSWLRVS
jgi:NAD(P)-dependent dehydrogenase (short-subunit alcohol dehydrogenase family)